MNDGILSQEEIDALLSAGNDSSSSDMEFSEQSSAVSDLEISSAEKDTMGEVGNISMGTAATTLSTLLNKKVSITTPDVSTTSAQELQSEYPLPYLIVEVDYTEGLSGTNILIIKEEDASVIADLMMGGEGKVEDASLSELGMSAVGEAMNQMMGSATTSLSSMFNRRIDIAPPKLQMVDLGKEALDVPGAEDMLVQIKFKMEIENLVDSEIMQIIPYEAVKSMMNTLLGEITEEQPVTAEVPPSSTPTSTPVQPPFMSQPVEPQQQPVSSQDMNNRELYADSSSNIRKDQQFAVQPAQFTPLRESELEHPPQNISLIMDVPLDVTVELGKTRKTIKDILELHQGSIIQLDKLAGEPVDLLVNGKLIARGEVVVIDENYGIRITAIISPMDRMSRLQ
jgi:flagellar motor switch protein FliN/FliY